MSKKQDLREKRRRQQRNQRVITISLVVAGAFLIAFALIYPSLKPVGQITPITPITRPMVQDNTMGDPNAPVRIDEYSDFQCPYCDRFTKETEPQIDSTYVATGKVYFVYHSFGNWIGAESAAAAEAAYCAGDQNKFWEYHDMLFANQTGENVGDFTDRRLQAFAEQLGLNMSDFNACYNSGKYKTRVAQDQVEGQQAGAQGTPYFVVSYTVNGQKQTAPIPGAVPFSEFQKAIEDGLTAVGQ
jgi:protein-disulfide isomerase